MAKNRLLTKKETATYASVLLDYALSADKVFELSTQIQDIQMAILMHPDLRSMLMDDQMSTKDRLKVLQAVFDKTDLAVLKVLAIMAERQDIALIHSFVTSYNALAEQALGVVIIDVTSAIELDDALREMIKKKFSAQFSCKVLLREHVDPSILGGIILSAHGQRIDASVATQLEQVHAALTSTEFRR